MAFWGWDVGGSDLRCGRVGFEMWVVRSVGGLDGVGESLGGAIYASCGGDCVVL